MATATVLRPHVSLRNQFFHRTPRLNDDQSSRCRRRKRNPTDSFRRSNHSTSPPSKALVMGQVKILKRGEDIKSLMFENSSDTRVDVSSGMDLCSTDRLGPDPATVKKQVRVRDLYAGVSAPPPSSVPSPAALIRRSVVESDLRKMLRI